MYGKREQVSIQIEAFRLIECEHASGPAFVLSAKDIEKLHTQIQEAGADPELTGMEPLGWFIAHTRGELALTAADAALAKDLFRRPWQVTLLVKPEKFKPTKFVFVNAGAPSSEITANLFTLPVLKGRSVRQEESSSPGPRPRRRRSPDSTFSPEKFAFPRDPVSGDLAKEAVLAEGAAAESSSPASPDLLSISLSQKRSRQWLLPVLAIVILLAVTSAFGYRFYWDYLVDPVPVTAAIDGGRLLVSWPADVTKEAENAVIRLTGEEKKLSIALSLSQRRNGTATFPVASSDLQIELIVTSAYCHRHGSVRAIGFTGTSQGAEPLLGVLPAPAVDKNGNSRVPASTTGR